MKLTTGCDDERPHLFREWRHPRLAIFVSDLASRKSYTMPARYLLSRLKVHPGKRMGRWAEVSTDFTREHLGHSDRGTPNTNGLADNNKPGGDSGNVLNSVCMFIFRSDSQVSPCVQQSSCSSSSGAFSPSLSVLVLRSLWSLSLCSSLFNSLHSDGLAAP